ncbi:MAG: sensor histidine kinase [Campylobacterota bacterium]|nr:sensor histidine kinase [Campylobacterota bacterium]
MYKEKKATLFFKHKQILKQVIYESDTIITEIERIGEYVKDKYPSKKHNLLTGLVRVKKSINTILILDNNGILKDFTSNLNIKLFNGFDYSNMEYFKSITNKNHNNWTEVYLSQATNKPSISYSIRIDENNIAVLVLDLSILNTFAEKFVSGDDSSMVRILDRNGIFLAHPQNKLAVSQRKNIKNSHIFKKYISNSYNDKQIIFNGVKNIENIGIYGVSEKLKWTIIVKERYDFIFDTFNTLMLFILLFIFILLVISVYFSLKLSKSILKPLDNLNSKIDDIAQGKNLDSMKESGYKELNLLSKNFLLMQNKIKDREELNRQKDKQIHDSAKMAQMGEMIGNIAHQWRQPLSIISTSASGMKMEKEFDLLTDDKFNIYCDGIVDQTQFLSNTIDTFRDFIKEKKEKDLVVLQERIDNVLNILDASLKNSHIKLINNTDYTDEIKLTIIKGELSQVIINIFNNAKDVLIERKIEEPYIKIETKKSDNHAIITIEDNAGGVPEDIIFKIFDPYFTTKHQSQGTGLGLHMSYKIIAESLNGKLYVKNTDIGAKFFIELPLS